MPPVAAAVAAIGSALVSAAPVIGAVGAGLSVVGTVTGNKKLMKIGGSMALVGGITSFASGALAGTAAAEGIAAGGIGEGLGGAGGALGAAADFGANTGLSYAGQGATTNGLTSVASQGTGLINQVSNLAKPQDVTATPNQNIGSQSSLPVSQASDGVSPPSDISFAGIRDWFNKLDPKTQSTILQSGAGAVGGLFEGWTQDQKLALERERIALDRERQTKGISNSSSQPVINFSPTGLINAPRTS